MVENYIQSLKAKMVMKRQKSIVLLVSAILLTSTVFAQKVSIFNGENLEGWKIYGTEKWYVEDGELICESGPDEAYGYLATEKFYKDFELDLEFYLLANGNSGVFFRSTIEGTKITGWQCEVEPAGNESGGIYESYGRGWLIVPDESVRHAQKKDQWNKLKLRVVGDKVTTWINGVQMVTLEDEKIGQANGSIALQIHDGGGIKVKWRNLMVEEL
jgi:hypothetical protein